jgi:hypothetical protein
VATPIEMQTLDSSSSGVRKRHLNSGWMRNLTPDEVDESRDTLEHIDPAVVIPLTQKKQNPRSPSDEEITSVKDKPARSATPAHATTPVRPVPAKPVYSARTDLTEMVRNPAQQRKLVMWLIPLLVGFVVFAAALGYFLGQRSR